MDDRRNGTPADTGDRSNQSRALGFRPGSHDVKAVTVRFADGVEETWVFGDRQPARYKATSNHRSKTTVRTVSGFDAPLWTDEYYDVDIHWTIP